MINFEDDDFDLAEGFLDEVLPPSRVPQRPAGGAVGSGGRRDTWTLPAGPGRRPDGPDDPGGFSCTPDSVSVSQMFGLRAAGGGGDGHRARPGAAEPASPDPSQVDPFADDFLDADLLDACEAAEATPAAANLPTANGVGPGSRDMPTSARVPDLGSRDAPATGAFPGPKSHDASTSGAFPRSGSRDKRNGVASPAPGSRDTPPRGSFPRPGSHGTPTSARSPVDRPRDIGRRSVGSAVKRRFPGPAGILPITGSLLTLAHEVSLQEDDLTATGEDDDHALHDAASQSQLSQAEEAADWEGGPWRQMQAELRLSAADPDCLLRRINIAAIRRAAAANQLRKVPLLATALLTLEPTSDLSYQATFRDPTGQMDGTVAKDAFEHCGAALRPGCVLVLRDVVVWRESARRLYLSVTRRSLVYLFSETQNGADAATVMQLSDLSAAELALARLVEEPPSVAVLQESPPPSPPRRPQLYPTPQLSGGGRPWRGRGGRCWRGRGAGTGSGGRPAPYTPRRSGGGGGGSPAGRTTAVTSPAARGAASASPALRTTSAVTRGAAIPSPAVNGPSGSSSRLFSGSTAGPGAARAASPALRSYSRPATVAPAVPKSTPGLPASAAARQTHPTAGAPATAPRSAPGPPTAAPAPVRHKPDTISAAEIDAMFDDDDDILFGQL